MRGSGEVRRSGGVRVRGIGGEREVRRNEREGVSERGEWESGRDTEGVKRRVGNV